VIRVALPYHLRTLASVGDEIAVDVHGNATIGGVIDAVEARYPVLCGTIREHDTMKRRAYLRFFACQEDLSHDPPDTQLPEAVVSGREAFLIVGAISGG
jgi:molybdopterin synthase sulfur carrier subunit